MVPVIIMITDKIFIRPGAFLCKIASTKTLIQTDCASNTMATLTAIYFTDR